MLEYRQSDTSKELILIDRKRRERALIGKYLVVVTSNNHKKSVDLYLQDSEYGSGYWTRFLSNAKGFYDESAAVVKAKNLQFNNPRVVFLQANGKLKEVYNNGRYERR